MNEATVAKESVSLGRTKTADALMSLVYVTSMYPPATGGAQIHIHEMAKLLRKAGHTVQVAMMASRQRTDWLRMNTVCTDPECNYSYEDVSVYQLGFDPATKLRILPCAMTYYALMSPAGSSPVVAG